MARKIRYKITTGKRPELMKDKPVTQPTEQPVKKERKKKDA